MLDEGGESLVKSLHAVFGTRLDDGTDLMGLSLTDEVANGRRSDHDLDRRYASLSIDGSYQLLRDDSLDRTRELHSDLLLLVAWEHVDDAIYRLRRILGVERSEDQVTGLGSGDRR